MQIAILGCGYVGRTLAKQLVTDGHDVVGARRSPNALSTIEKTGADAVEADLTDPPSLEAIPDSDVVVIAASSSGLTASETREVFVSGMGEAIAHFSGRNDPPTRMLYTSTTGVYGDYGGGWVDEETMLAPSAPKTAVLAEAELSFRNAASRRGIEPIVVRFGGIYGPDRYRIGAALDRPIYPGYRNLVHREDAAGSLKHMALQGADGHDTVIVVDDEPVDRPTFVTWLAEQAGVDPPPRGDPDHLLADPDRSLASIRRLRESKRCDNRRLHAIGYELSFPTYREGYESAVAAYRGR